ncbi:hypothetical protein [Marivirga sp.]|nr:hypothetical protein [Marivirga sp.]
MFSQRQADGKSLFSRMTTDKDIYLEQRTRKNYQVVVRESRT